MPFPDYAQERKDQIEELMRWANEHTSYGNISPRNIVKFFDGSTDPEVAETAQVCQKMVDWAREKFKIGSYTARDYANTILLRKTNGHDIAKIREEIVTGPSVRPMLSYTAKLKITMDALSQIWSQTHEVEIPYKMLVEKLMQSGAFAEAGALIFVEKAVKTGALLSSKPGYLKRG